MNSVAQNLKQIRLCRSMTQDALAEKLNVTRQTISSWERGRSEPDIETLMSLSKVLEVDISELIYGIKHTNTAEYATFQKRYIICCSVCAFVILAAFIMQIVLLPHLTELSQRWYKPYALHYQLIVPPLACFAIGVLVPAFVSLFFQIRFGKRLAAIFTVFGVITALLVLIAEISMISSINLFPFFTYLWIKPIGKMLLQQMIPILSGMMLFFGTNR